MRFTIIVLLIVLTVQVKISFDTTCGCEQLYVEQDCQNAGCQWKDEKCQVKLQSEATSSDSSASYCSQFNATDCGKQTGCAYLVDRCVEFASCSSYLQSTNSLCQAISSKCITDGTKCVDLGDCTTYKNTVSCVKDSQSNYCYWDGFECVVATTCAQLPKFLISDADCRAINTQCTVSSSGGCQMSGLTCLEQVGELQCVWDRGMTLKCAWNGQTCVEKSCGSAPISIRSTNDCKTYLSGCVAQLGGGCMVLGECSNIQVDDACLVDNLGNTCYWYDGKCNNKECSNAPSLLGTFQQCQNFLSTCVPTKKGGCKTFTTCADLEDLESCNGGLLQCIWNDEKNLCLTYSCVNASQKYNTYDLCTQFKQDCTVNGTNNGCSDRTCDNAPKIINTNYDCDQYKNGCITKSGGGCVTNADCQDIHYQDACLIDSQNRQCFWYNNSCYLKICSNAPSLYNTHEQCQLFSKLCTVKKTLNGCIDLTCDVVFQQNNCISDYLGQKCHWNGLCFDKTCDNAPLTLIDDSQCSGYLSSCTVRDSGAGCKTRPYQCMEMVLQAQCVTDAYGVECEWSYGECKIKSCWTADVSYSTYEACNAYFPGCTTTGNGCQPLIACNLYMNSNSCRFDQSGTDCEWNAGTCADKNCLTADSTHTSNALCNTYLTGCIVAASGSGCMAKPSSCGGMTTALQCTATSTNLSGGPCAWIGTCVDRTCSNAPSTTDYDTFTKCNAFLNTCTVVATGTGGCMTMVTSCSAYTSQRQCEQLLNGNKCSWYLAGCVDRQCIYSPDTASYDDKFECDAYDNRCDVVRRVGGNGCTLRKSNCNYLSEHQCVKDSNGTICTWNTNASPPYCLNRTCALTIGIVSFTPANCAAWLSTCVVNNLASPSACMDRQSSCISYSYAANCTYTSSNVQCYWNGSSCVTRTCTTTSGITDFDHTSCYSWMNSCTVNWPTSCSAKPTNCSDAINYDQCYKNSSNQLCAWVGTACVDRTCTNHGYAVTVFTDTNCSAWMPGCSGNPDQSECEITRTCTNHGSNVTTFTHNNCTGWSPLCTVSSDSTSCIDRTCTNTNLIDFSSTNCSAWLSKCTSNDDHTACISARTCSNYGSAITVFNNDTCGAWWEECIVSGSTCTQKTCYNHSLTVINFTNCNNWYYKCTASRDLLTCQPKTCGNAILASYTAETCLDWLYTCTVNSSANGCITKRTCSVTDLTTFNYTNCSTWLNECTYTTLGQCNDKNCSNYSSNVSPISHINCESWLHKCTYYNSACTDKTCYNYNDFVQQYNNTNCSNWLLMCTVNQNSTGCEPKTCLNHSLTTFTTATCQGWLKYCQANASGTACENTRACSPSLSTYSHVNCENYNYQCTYNNGSSCRYKACTDTYIITYNHQFCNSYLSDCTVNSPLTACEQKTCYNHGAQISTLNHSNCEAWLPNCTAGNVYSSCIPKSCTNTNVTVFTNANCMAWWSGCVANNTGTACLLIRTCTNHNFTSTTHATCENWLSTCTNNGTTTCQSKTCTLASGKLQIYDPLSCEMWLSTCTSSYDQTSCISRTCYNHGDQVTVFSDANCSGWLSYCVANSSASGCIANITCSNAIVSSYNHANCNAWLSSCTVNSTFDGCVTKTCSNYGTNITTFNHTNCYAWLSTCTNSSTTACQDKSCSNINTGTYTSVSCNTWSPYCIANDTQTACLSIRTCSNAVVTSYTHLNCYTWLSSCTVNPTNDGCTDITCSNTTPLTLSGPFNDSICNTWKSTCTVNTTLDGCADRTCSNINVTPSTSNCQSWGSCQFDGTQCVARTCTNHDSMTLSVANCSSWLSSCSYYSSGDCEVIRTCSNFSGTVNHSNCENWLSTCTCKSDSSGCITKTCSAYTTVIGTPSQQSDCENYLSSCKYDSANTVCVEKTCNNYSGSISQANCEAWSSRCTINSSYNGCTYKNSSNSITLSYTDSLCKKWSEAWSLNSTLNGCTTNCQDNGLHFSSYTHSNCQNWDYGCTVNSSSTGCAVKTCANFTGAVNYTNCTNWLSTCTNSYNNASCIDRTCYNQLQNFYLWYSVSQCSNFRSDCTYATNYSCKINVCSDYNASSAATCATYQSYCLQGQLQCMTQRTCSNYGSNISVFNHLNCERWLSTCTVNSAGTGCEVKTCSNASISTQLLNGYNTPTGMDSYQCVAWNKQCINNGTTGCKLRKNTDVTSSCESYLAGFHTVSYFNYCDNKTCLSSSSIGSASTCVSWMSYCTSSQSKRACITQRTCSNYGSNISVFNQYNCEQWNSLCTVNGTNDGCMYKTCFNHGMTTTTNTLCGQWLYTCKANASLNGCEIRTCTNYGNAFTNSFSAYCPYWMSGQCTYNSVNSACIPNRTCAQAYHGYNTKYDKYFCQDWLSTCTPNAGMTACIDKTCTNHGSEVTTFNHSNCYNWYDICTNDGSTACMNKTCLNHGSNVTTLNATNCGLWLPGCTFQTGESTCNYKSCTNYSSITLSAGNCSYYNTSCTYISGSYDCEYKTCANYSSTISEAGCRGWLSYCTPDQSGSRCVSTRSCSVNQLTTFTNQSCANWMPTCTVNTTNDGCMDRSCDNYGTNLASFTLVTCSGWLSYCTNNSTTKCEIKHCTNYPNGMSITNANCSKWYSNCIITPTSTNCQFKTCSNHSLSTFNHANCSGWLSYCTVNSDASACVATRTCAQAPLTLYTHGNCQNWLSTCTVNSGATACETRTCTNHGSFVTSFTHSKCQDWDFSCTVNSGGTACEAKSCTNTSGITFTHANCQTWLSTCTVNSGGTACISKSCSNTTGISSWTHSNCEVWLSSCQLNKPTSCKSLQSNCSNAGVSYNQCVIDSGLYNCSWYNGSCLRRTCSNYTGTTFTHSDCETWLSTCTVQAGASPTMCVNKPTHCTDSLVEQDQCVTNISLINCVWLSGSCQDRTCANYTGATFTHTDCQTWLSICTVDNLGTHAGCVIKPQQCSQIMTQDQCVVDYNNNVCFWTGTVCKTRTCEDAAQTTSYDDDSKCLNFLKTCSVARIGECTTKFTNCSDYVEQSICYKNSAQGVCFWNTDTSLCADIKCSNAPTSYVTHNQCNTFLASCTALPGGGCMTLNGCLNYSGEVSCVISNSGNTCAWIGGKCYVKSCYTASYDSTHDTHTECQSYLPNCTVIATGTGGCVPLADCTSYTTERQCVINNLLLLCGWNGTKCDIKSCSTAPQSYNQHVECESYLNECTTVAIGNGCQMKNDSCNQYQSEKQCVITINDQSCYWNPDSNACEIRTCQNAPSTSLTAQLCESHYQFCYTDYVYCRIQICTDLHYTTDQECKIYNCATNGVTCIERKQCSDAPQKSCTTDINNEDCEWVSNRCVKKTCATSPIYNITEQDCQSYYPLGNCTTKIGGGCKQKGTCKDATVFSACTTSLDNQQCVWENDSCRSQTCDDIQGTSQEYCQLRGCIFNGLKCSTPQPCSGFAAENVCVNGTDGQCKWISGQCIVYTGCSSYAGQSDAICKQLSSNCTSNGTTCIGIDLCANYSVEEACKFGLDGDCIWWSSLAVCKRFLSCYDLPYLTHQTCYAASNKCTTDTLNGCIPLLLCSQYNYQDQCKLSANGKESSNNKIISTGKCKWVPSVCRDQICEDLLGETHEACESQLYGCTSDSTQCITMSQCEDYDQLACINAQSTNGRCIYSGSLCQTQQCTDIKYGFTHETCLGQQENCISDGTQCIDIDVCANLLVQYSCSYGGLDGDCAWSGTSCQKITQCSDADSDEATCQKFKEKCLWSSDPVTGTSCSPLSCTDLTTDTCQNILTFDETEATLCGVQNQICTEIETSNLDAQNCYSNTYNTYYWNTQTQVCSSCSVSNTTNSTNSTNSNSDATRLLTLILLILYYY